MITDMTNFTLLDVVQDLTCHLIPGYGCSNDTWQSGLDCNTNDIATVKFNCELNIDVQNETSYSCYSCSNQTMDLLSNSSTCSSNFKLNMVTIIFESALKNLWFKLPEVDFCYDNIVCSNEGGNRTLYVDVSNNSLSTVYDTFQCSFNTNVTEEFSDKVGFEWTFLFVILFIIAGGVGNILVCLAVCLDKRLQNVTNYFLLSLAIADLLVSLFVMPMGAIPGFLGKLSETQLSYKY